MNASDLIHRYLLGLCSKAETGDLERLLAADPALRREFAVAAATDAGLRNVAMERQMEPPALSRPGGSLSWAKLMTVLVAIAAVALALVGGAVQFTKTVSVATLVSSENAAWESALPTTVGSSLSPGSLKLIAGIATIRFRSGAEVTLEAPAQFELLTSMRSKLIDGAVIVNVPESAEGFVVETPDGYAVDHGTQFAVSVQGELAKSDFEVLKGEISVHHPASGKDFRLTDRQGAAMTHKTLIPYDGERPEAAFADTLPLIRVGTEGQSSYVIRNNRRGKWIHPEMLVVKWVDDRKWDSRAFFSMDVSSVDLTSVTSVRLRLNQVASGKGFASRLPVVNTFAVYGITHVDKQVWGVDPTWEDAPDVDDGVLLGVFDIPRSQQKGVVGIETSELLDFLKADPDGKVTFVLVRTTGLIEGEDRGLAHAFANDANPEASGPLLEFTIK
ncbi:FecR domain-containing protein [Rubripirellula reticaptiva]|uniref:FecR protein n=1 Tax=Rubripirellula reticaptiva TaxID=2528013 RepID=A0A5C6F7E6_9BACT|nr:FecR domain-containing protein [Rubripirellula reticaptiva]TWU57633.1 FecR protein [Rubripirellula reticaptiva]